MFQWENRCYPAATHDSSHSPCTEFCDGSPDNIIGLLNAKDYFRLEDIEKTIGIELDSQDHNTLTGLVFETLGSIPADGEQDISLSIEGMDIRVLRIEEHQIERATITVLTKEEEEE